MKKLAVLLLFISSHAHAADAQLKLDILMCESSNRHHDFRSPRIRYGDDGVSRGIAQFRRETFYEQAKAARKAGKWPFKKPHWLNKEQQLWLMDYMLDKGLGPRWTCYGMIKRGEWKR